MTVTARVPTGVHLSATQRPLSGDQGADGARTLDVPPPTPVNGPSPSSGVGASSGRTSRSAWSTVTASRPAARLRQTPARVDAGLGGQLDLLLAGGAHPAGEPLRRQLGLRGAESPGAGPDENLGAQSAELPRRRTRRRPGRAGAPAPSRGVGGRRTRRPRGGPADPPGVSSTRPTTDRVSSTGHPAPAQTATSPASSSSVSMSSSAEAVIRVAPARSPGAAG